jgi:N-acetylmuramoyl-L-alanine amidase
MRLCQMSALILTCLCTSHSLADPGTQGRHSIIVFGHKHRLDSRTLKNGVILLSRPGLEMALTPGNRRVRINDMSIYMNDPLRSTPGKLTISDADAHTVLAPILGTPVLQEIGERPCVVLDPGHGGPDPGASGYHRTVEKRLALDIARRVRRKLGGTGIDVHLTRDRDHGLTLQGRVASARSRRADMFISIHLNSGDNRRAQGIETFVLPARGYPSTSNGTKSHARYPGNDFDALNTLLASCVHKGVLSRTDATDRGVRRARFSVLRNATFPAVLMECGFLSNHGEAQQLRHREYRDLVAEGITRGILTYVSKVEAPVRSAQSDRENVETGSTDRAGLDMLPDDTEPKTSAPKRAQDLRPSDR